MGTFRGADATGESDTGSRFFEAGAFDQFTEEHEKALNEGANASEEASEQAGQ